MSTSTMLGNEQEKRLLQDLDALRQLAADGGDDHDTKRELMDDSEQRHPNFQPPASSCDFQMGDHVYKWCSFALVPAAFQHHGIVMDVFRRRRRRTRSIDVSLESGSISNNDDDDFEWMMTIADFSNAAVPECEHEAISSTKEDTEAGAGGDAGSTSHQSFQASSGKSVKGVGSFRTYDVACVGSKETWHKVEYQAGWWTRHLRRTGTCTAVPSDAAGLVRARVQFLKDHGAKSLLPRYNVWSANCECVAVWCKTGTWATLQAVNFLAMTAAGQAKSAVTVASAAAATQVTVPAAGFWGSWLGYTTHVSLLSTQPYLLPAIATYGVVTAGAPALWLLRSKRLGQQLTTTLNTEFWAHAMNHPQEFADCLTMWSSVYDPFTDDDDFVVLTHNEGRVNDSHGATVTSNMKEKANDAAMTDLSNVNDDSQCESSSSTMHIQVSNSDPAETPDELAKSNERTKIAVEA